MQKAEDSRQTLRLACSAWSVPSFCSSSTCLKVAVLLGKALAPGDAKAAPAVAGSAAPGLSSLMPSQTAEEHTGILPEGLIAPPFSSHSQRWALPTLLSTDSTMTFKMHWSSSLEAGGALPICQAALHAAHQSPGVCRWGLPARTSSQGAQRTAFFLSPT